MMNKEVNFEEIVENEMNEEQERKQPGKFRQFWDKHGEKILYGGIMVLTLAGFGVAVGVQLHNGKVFENDIKAKYGPKATAGNIFGGNPKKLWGQNQIWEEKYKSNFDSVYDLAKQLNLKPEENFSIEKVYDDGELVTQVVQFTKDGYYHGNLC